MLRVTRAGPDAAIWYTSGLPDGDYLLRALVGAERTQAASEAAEIHLDNTPPACRLVAPAKFAVLRGSVRLLGEAIDTGSGVAAVEFEYARAAGAWMLLGSTASMPFSLLWPTHHLPDGAYRLRCLARDCIGNRAASEAVAVLLTNAPLPGRPPEPSPPVTPSEREPDPDPEPPTPPPEPQPRPPEPVPPMPERPPAPGSAGVPGAEPPRLGQAATLWHLERLLAEQGRSDPRRDERNALLYALRSVARPDGTIPEEFWTLIEETFGELLA